MDRVQSISQILSVSSRIHLPDGYLIRLLVCHSSTILRSFYSYKYTNTLVCLLRYQRQVIWPCVCDHSLRSLYVSLVHFTLRVLLTSKQSFSLTNAPCSIFIREFSRMLNKQQQCERYLVPAICESFLSAVLLPFLLSELPSLLLEPFSSRIPVAISLYFIILLARVQFPSNDDPVQRGGRS